MAVIEAVSIDRLNAMQGIIVDDSPEISIPVEPLSGKPARKRLETDGLRREEGLAIVVGLGLTIDGIANFQIGSNILSVLVNNPLISAGVTVSVLNSLVGEVRDAHERNVKRPLEL
jgi:hypothetical protein